MKKKIILIFVIICVSLTSKIYAQYFPIDTLKLNTAYRELMKSPNKLSAQENFFNAFPSTWMQYMMTYQYLPNKGYDLTMYNNLDNHIRALRDKITLIDDSTYCAKLVDIAIGGKWEGDAPSHLQSLLHIVMWKKMDTMFQYISKLRKGHQMLFWQFYWSNLVKQEKLESEFKRMVNLNINLHPEQVKIMSIAFQYFHNGVAPIRGF